MNFLGALPPFQFYVDFLGSKELDLQVVVSVDCQEVFEV